MHRTLPVVVQEENSFSNNTFMYRKCIEKLQTNVALTVKKHKQQNSLQEAMQKVCHSQNRDF